MLVFSIDNLTTFSKLFTGAKINKIYSKYNKFEVNIHNITKQMKRRE